jgi:hypothetical protein
MRVAWLSVLLVVWGCGDDASSTDASADATADASSDAGDADAAPAGRTFWIADDGDDAADGSESAPFATFSHAIAQLAPGDTLIARAGSTFGRLSFDCLNNSCDGEPCPSGERGRPITVRAETPRSVELTALEEALVVRQCSHVVIDGFEAHQRDEESTDFATIALIADSDHLVLRNMLLHTLNRWVNGHVLFLARSSHVLVEDSEIYDFHRGAVIISASEHVTARRIYVNGRGTPNLPEPAFNCCCLEDADYGMWISGSFDVTIENVLVERVCEPFVVIGQEEDLGLDRAATGTRILGSMSLSSRYAGFGARSYCEDANPCPEINHVRDLEIVDSVAIDASDAVHMNAVQNVLVRNFTSVDIRDDAFVFRVGTENVAIDDSSFLVVNALDVGTADLGYLIENHDEGTILSSNTSGVVDDLDPMFTPMGLGSADAALDGCRVYVPDASPMRGAGAGGADIGARIVNRYVDGTLTDEPLWDPSTGAFPCGATVDGVNDEATFPNATCSTVHERLNVGTNGCAIP